jgi:uncharacterized protein YndB with AHSA1/START domain
MGMGGTFHEIKAPERIVHTEAFDEDWTGGPTRVTSVFAEEAKRTKLTMTIAFVSREAREGALGTGMTRGMEQSYERLDEQVAEAMTG